jgi:hypothetical protein
LIFRDLKKLLRETEKEHEEITEALREQIEDLRQEID